jgi:hypothetical protein
MRMSDIKVILLANGLILVSRDDPVRIPQFAVVGQGHRFSPACRLR